MLRKIVINQFKALRCPKVGTGSYHGAEAFMYLTSIRLNSSTTRSTDDSVPDNFYDEKLEKMIAANEVVRNLLGTRDIRNIAVTKDLEEGSESDPKHSKLKAAEIDELLYNSKFNVPVGEEGGLRQFDDNDEDDDDDQYMNEGDNVPVDPTVDISDGFGSPLDKALEHSHMFEHIDDDAQLENRFVSVNDGPAENIDEKSNLACPGKLQRKGKSPELRCDKIDLDQLQFTDVLLLRKYLTADAEILPRSRTKLCAKCQRKVAKTIKTARQFALLPHIGDYQILDSKPEMKNAKKFHGAHPPETRRIKSRTAVLP